MCKIYTGQFFFTQALPVVPVTNMRYESATICVFLDQVQAFNPTFCVQPIKLQTKSYKDCKREEQSYTTHLDDKVKTFFP